MTRTRCELKYRISQARAAAVRRSIRHYTEPDRHGGTLHGGYPIHSLYLDGPDWSLYRDTRNGCASRFKLRARTYSFEPGAPVFLEVKSREAESMQKSRAEVDRDDAGRVLRGRAPERAAPSDALESFRLLQHRRDAFPRVWITYRREAFVAQRPLGLVRVTFDSDIGCAPATSDLREPESWLLLPEVRGLVVLELKYHGAAPGWLADLIRWFSLERQAMSKYRAAVDVLRGTAATVPRSAHGVSPAWALEAIS